MRGRLHSIRYGVMALVLFLRGVNVGGHKTFKPSALAKELAHLDAVSIGAAGTFVIRKRASQAALRSEILKKLPIEPELMICSAREVIDLAGGDPFAKQPADANEKRYVTIMDKPPRLPKGVRLPFTKPAGDQWQVKIIAVQGRFALSLHRRMGKRLIYPNEVVEKAFGVLATTRNWNTIEAVCKVIISA
jgi:uncharacterized protein (DUF1697 family)